VGLIKTVFSESLERTRLPTFDFDDFLMTAQLL